MNHLLETLKVYLVVLPPEPVSVPLLVLRLPALSPLHQHRVRGLQLLQHRRARRHHRGDHHAHAAVLHFHLALYYHLLQLRHAPVCSGSQGPRTNANFPHLVPALRLTMSRHTRTLHGHFYRGFSHKTSLCRLYVHPCCGFYKVSFITTHLSVIADNPIQFSLSTSLSYSRFWSRGFIKISLNRRPKLLLLKSYPAIC